MIDKATQCKISVKFNCILYNNNNEKNKQTNKQPEQNQQTCLIGHKLCLIELESKELPLLF